MKKGNGYNRKKPASQKKPMKSPEQMVEDMRKNKGRMPTKGTGIFDW